MGSTTDVLLLDFGQLFASAFDLVKSARVGIAANGS
jgi:hypothetical protein